MRTCPECGAKVARSLLLCDCGYHFQTRRVLERNETPDADDATVAANVAALRGDADGPPPRIWLARAAVLLQILAALGALVSLVWSASLVSEWVKADASTSATRSDATSGLLTLLLVLLGGAVQFILTMATSEAATALREVERHTFALRQKSRGG